MAFADTTAYDFHLHSSDTTAKDAGTDLSGTFTDDIDGDTRSGTWDIGADESQASASRLGPLKPQEQLMHKKGYKDGKRYFDGEPITWLPLQWMDVMGTLCLAYNDKVSTEGVTR